MPKHTPLYEEHIRLGGKMIEFADWEMPVQYTGVSDEHTAVRRDAGIFDVSHMGIFEISGPDAIAFLQCLTPNDIEQLKPGQAHYSLLLTDRGTLVDDVIVYRLAESLFFLVVNASNLEKDFAWITDHKKGEVTIKDKSSDYALIAIQGPRAAKILSETTDADIDSIAPFHLASGNIGDVDGVTFARTGYTGEDGFELFIPSQRASSVWITLLEAGKRWGLKPIGLGARDTLRMEMKYCLYGHEITDRTNALEAGLRWVIKFKKPYNFIGREALTKTKKEGITRKLVGFQMIEKGIPRHGYPIVNEDQEIGVVTSGTFSPSLKAPIGIGYVKTDFSTEGTKIYIDIRGKKRLAEVVKTPFYRRDYGSSR